MLKFSHHDLFIVKPVAPEEHKRKEFVVYITSFAVCFYKRIQFLNI